jgi:hypothetical protein
MDRSVRSDSALQLRGAPSAHAGVPPKRSASQQSCAALRSTERGTLRARATRRLASRGMAVAEAADMMKCNIALSSLLATAFSVALSPAAMAADEAKASSPDVPASVASDNEWKESFFTPKKKPPARMAIGINPIGLLFGLLEGEVDYGLGEQLSLAINGQYLNMADTTAWGVGVGAQYFLTQVASSGPLYQGFYIYPSLQIASVSVSSSFLGFESHTSYVAFAPQAVAGWQIDWRPFTMRLGAGAAYYIGEADDGFDSALSSGLHVIVDGMIGVTFGG